MCVIAQKCESNIHNNQPTATTKDLSYLNTVTQMIVHEFVLNVVQNECLFLYDYKYYLSALLILFLIFETIFMYSPVLRKSTKRTNSPSQPTTATTVMISMYYVLCFLWFTNKWFIFIVCKHILNGFSHFFRMLDLVSMRALWPWPVEVRIELSKNQIFISATKF